jgi:hypothetical protein
MTLAAFTPEQYATAHRLLAAKVARMMGRKLEEGDWADVYCRAKGLPSQRWSNLNIDVRTPPNPSTSARRPTPCLNPACLASTTTTAFSC